MRQGVRAVYRFVLLLVFCSLGSPLYSAEFRLGEGDRVALVGSTLIEREQRYGYWETALTIRFPGVTFRNVGWSGDTVWGESRVGFDLDNPRKGFERLRDAVLAVKPTVIIVGYGTNESFAGEAGIPILPHLFHPDRWLLWLGILFVASVYFFPSGVVGKLRGGAG